MKEARSVHKRNIYMLSGMLKKNGFDCWRHSFTARESMSGEEKTFFIDFFVINPALSSDSVVLAQRPDAQRKKLKPSYVLVKAGCFGKNARQINNFYPLKELVRKKGALDLQAGSCQLTETAFIGSVSVAAEDAERSPECMTDSGVMRWDVQIARETCFSLKKPPLLSGLFSGLPRLWNIAYPQTRYSGIIHLDNKEYRVIPEKSFGYADKIWGNSFDSGWLRIACCNLKSQFTSKSLADSSLMITASKSSVEQGAALFSSVVFLNYEGRIFKFDFFNKITHSGVTVFFSQDEEFCNWSFSAKSAGYVLDVSVQYKKIDMIPLFYEQPDGKKITLSACSSGSGEVKLYQKNGRRIEALEHIQFSGARCEYGGL